MVAAESTSTPAESFSSNGDRAAPPALLVEDQAPDGGAQDQIPQACLDAAQISLDPLLLDVKDALLDVVVFAPQLEAGVSKENGLRGLFLPDDLLQDLEFAEDAFVHDLNGLSVVAIEDCHVFHDADGAQLDIRLDLVSIHLETGRLEAGVVVLQVNVELCVVEDNDDVALLDDRSFRSDLFHLEGAGGNAGDRNSRRLLRLQIALGGNFEVDALHEQGRHAHSGGLEIGFICPGERGATLRREGEGGDDRDSRGGQEPEPSDHHASDPGPPPLSWTVSPRWRPDSTTTRSRLRSPRVTDLRSWPLPVWTIT
jgi:hypothetical protein